MSKKNEGIPHRRGNEQKQGTQFDHATITERELVTLKGVLYGYLGFLRNIHEPKSLETQACLQTVYDRLSMFLETGDTLYVEYEERIAILEAVIGFKLLLVSVFPYTERRDVALADVERLYQCLITAKSLPLN